VVGAEVVNPEMQQITLERGDLLQLVPISNTGTIKLLPLGKKNKVLNLVLLIRT
jgi:hypothetical protein